jgi:predicted HTH transcriptional regulator
MPSVAGEVAVDGDVDEELLSLLDDEYARTILVATREEGQSAQALSELCGADDSTIYRRIERLAERDLLEAQQQLDPGGNHYKTYSARLERVEIRFHDDGITIEVDRREPAADRFTRLYEEFTG